MPDQEIREQPTRLPGSMPMRTGERFSFNFSKVSWGAIWGGVMVTLGMESLFIAFGLFISGLLGGSDPWNIAWYLVTMCVSFYAGGRAAGRLSNVADREICILHGMSTWGLATIFTLLMEGAVWFAALLKTPTPVELTVSWGPTVLYGGVIWGGVVLGLIFAYIGGASGIPRLAAQDIPTVQPTQEPLRRVS